MIEAVGRSGVQLYCVSEELRRDKEVNYHKVEPCIFLNLYFVGANITYLPFIRIISTTLKLLYSPSDLDQIYVGGRDGGRQAERSGASVRPREAQGRQGGRDRGLAARWFQQPKTDPHHLHSSRQATLFSLLRFAMFSSTWGSPEVG